MCKEDSNKFKGTFGDIALERETKKNEREFPGDRTREEYSALARDPARGNKVDYKGQKERSIALDLENQKLLGHVIRDPQKDKGADFIDTTTGKKWDIKSPVSNPAGHTSPRKGAFNLEKMMANVQKEIIRGNSVILDVRKLKKKDRETFKTALKERNLLKFIIWYEKRNGKKGNK